MKLYAFKFNPDAEDRSPKEIEEAKRHISEYLVTMPASSIAEQFWSEGHVDMAGYRFSPQNATFVLVNDGEESTWTEHFVPERNEDLARKYIEYYSYTGDVSWMFLDFEEIRKI